MAFGILLGYSYSIRWGSTSHVAFQSLVLGSIPVAAGELTMPAPLSSFPGFLKVFLSSFPGFLKVSTRAPGGELPYYWGVPLFLNSCLGIPTTPGGVVVSLS